MKTDREKIAELIDLYYPGDLSVRLRVADKILAVIQLKEQPNKICKHCQEPIALRNPSGYCDHLYYPDNCNICKPKDKIEPLGFIEPEHEILYTKVDELISVVNELARKVE